MIITNLVDGHEYGFDQGADYTVLRAPFATIAYFHPNGIEPMEVSGQDNAAFFDALAAAPSQADRHDELADGMRAEAGRIAFSIGDTMLRARLLDYLDAWGGLLGDLVEATEEGELYEPQDEDVAVRLLKVVCPSTARTYVTRVPEDFTTVKDARLWLNRGISPEVET